jgi:LTXXQ motif family protein
MCRFVHLALMTFLLVPSTSWVQAQQPYAGLESRPIKALSEQQISDLKAGRGMGLAIAAELNGYPGPIHVLEFADALALTPAQGAEIRQLVAGMKAEAIPLGERLIAQEAELDRAFASKTITLESLGVLTAGIGTTQAALRAAHLKYHLSTAAVLTPTQAQRYAELRGYAGHSHNQHGNHQR